MRTGFEVRACTASLPHIRKKNSFHKLIHVISIFMTMWFSAIQEIFLALNYFRITVTGSYYYMCIFVLFVYVVVFTWNLMMKMFAHPT